MRCVRCCGILISIFIAESSFCQRNEWSLQLNWAGRHYIYHWLAKGDIELNREALFFYPYYYRKKKKNDAFNFRDVQKTRFLDTGLHYHRMTKGGKWEVSSSIQYFTYTTDYTSWLGNWISDDGYFQFRNIEAAAGMAKVWDREKWLFRAGGQGVFSYAYNTFASTQNWYDSLHTVALVTYPDMWFAGIRLYGDFERKIGEHWFIGGGLRTGLYRDENKGDMISYAAVYDTSVNPNVPIYEEERRYPVSFTGIWYVVPYPVIRFGQRF